MAAFVKVTFFRNVGCYPNIVDETLILTRSVWKKDSDKFASIFSSVYPHLTSYFSFATTQGAKLYRRQYNNNFKQVIWQKPLILYLRL